LIQRAFCRANAPSRIVWTISSSDAAATSSDVENRERGAV
jgi:hypothetical protein